MTASKEQLRCIVCGNAIRRIRQHSKAKHAARKYCSQKCSSGDLMPKRVKSPDEVRTYIRLVAPANTNGCWHYEGGVTSHGYPSLTHNGRSAKGHRLSYEAFVGPIPKGMSVCHRCDNRRCVNPEHLFLGTNAENVRDRNLKGRQARGETAGRARIREADVRHIRQSGLPSSVLAKQLGISRHTVAGIRARRSWVHVE